MKHAYVAPGACRVTAQYRLHDDDGFVYELEGMGSTLAVHVTRIPPTVHGDDWRVAAHNGTGESGVVIAESGPTRSEALGRVARAWNAHLSELQLPRFDWDAITTALTAIRAI